MPSTIQVDVLTPDEHAAKLARVAEQNEADEKVRLATQNRLEKRPQPKPGDRYFVTTQIHPGRSRARCHFLPGRRTEVRVVAAGEKLGPVLEGGDIAFYAVDVNGAEMILADNALSFNVTAASDVEPAELRRQLALKDAEIARLTKEHARQLREARQAAPSSIDGRPERLIAAGKAAAVQGKDDPAFGGEK